MGGLTRKGQNLKIRTITRQKVRKNLSFQPVIRKVDVEAIKDEWGKRAPKKSKTEKKSATSPKDSSKNEAVMDAKPVEAQAEQLIQEKSKVEEKDSKEVNAPKEDTPVAEKKNIEKKAEPKAEVGKKPEAPKNKKEAEA
jgi:hypothetical protein